ncbi:hypothetical protein MtrunA17_Chr4g0060081 [Medicago truncatula]|uniref:Uncharacterized protein n=1 Tax=Medicago truncatula TaxID=3880 RepID=A0A396IFL5_MEDTR|nr:hypothetical protein MtrunA17_Chr4g0060081 [Medicago truncatula]
MNKVESTKHTHQPIKPLKMIIIQVFTQQPWCFSKCSSHLIDNRHKNSAKKISHSQ